MIGGGGGSVAGGDGGAVVGGAVGGSLAIGPKSRSINGSGTPCGTAVAGVLAAVPVVAGVLAAVPARPAVAFVGGELGCVGVGTEADWAVVLGTAVRVVVGGTVGEPAKTSGSFSDENGTRSTTAANAAIAAMVPIAVSTRRARLLVRITLLAVHSGRYVARRRAGFRRHGCIYSLRPIRRSDTARCRSWSSIHAYASPYVAKCGQSAASPLRCQAQLSRRRATTPPRGTQAALLLSRHQSVCRTAWRRLQSCATHENDNQDSNADIHASAVPDGPPSHTTMRRREVHRYGARCSRAQQPVGPPPSPRPLIVQHSLLRAQTLALGPGPAQHGRRPSLETYVRAALTPTRPTTSMGLLSRRQARTLAAFVQI